MAFWNLYWELWTQAILSLRECAREAKFPGHPCLHFTFCSVLLPPRINSLKGFPKILNCEDLYDHPHNGLYALEKDSVPAFICTSSRTVSWDTHQCHQLPPNLTNGVLGLYAEEKGWREVVDFVDTGLVLFASQVLRLEIAMQPKGQVPDGRKTLQIINWSTKFSIRISLVFNVVIFVFFFSPVDEEVMTREHCLVVLPEVQNLWCVFPGPWRWWADLFPFLNFWGIWIKAEVILRRHKVKLICKMPFMAHLEFDTRH